MCPPPKSSGQSGGVSISGKVSTVAGDMVGRDKVLSGGAYVDLGGDKSRENVVEILKMELLEKNKQISDLQQENRRLNQQLDSTAAVFRMVEMSVDKCCTVNDYIIHTHIFFLKTGQHKEFWNSILEEVRKAGRKNG